MDLKSRVKQLRQQTGTSAAPRKSADLGARLLRLQTRGRRCAPAVSPVSEGRLAERLGGQVLDQGVLMVERRVALSEMHGDMPISILHHQPLYLPGMGGRVTSTAPHGQYRQTTDEVAVPVGDLLFMDTETTGLSGGSGTLVFVLGLGRIEGDYLILRQYLLTTFGGERSLLDLAGNWLRGGETLVSFNGKSFDVPLLQTRGCLSGVPDPFGKMPHLDLLHPLRRVFKDRWPNCRLANAERKLMGFHRLDDLPGAEAPAAWFDWLRHKDSRRLIGVLDHNRSDLISLAVLLPLLVKVYQSPLRYEADVLAVARSWIREGQTDTALSLLEYGRSKLSRNGLMELARLWRNQGCWESACGVWWSLARAGDETATEHLAKFHEHVTGDFDAALRLSLKLTRSSASRRRCQRLSDKLNRLSKQVG
ncbi:MAG: ribonuclease H-like domain-containing protein [Gammaproteobacteria bacterium]|nr:ribonuclease H-like domain-containing protein [Gammaproteobacteria bacterium]